MCNHGFASSGTLCDDHRSCTSGDTCNANGGCSGTVKPDGQSCDDGNLCTDGDRCNAGGKKSTKVNYLFICPIKWNFLKSKKVNCEYFRCMNLTTKKKIVHSVNKSQLFIFFCTEFEITL